MSLQNLFKTLKSEGIVKHIDQYLIISYADDADRRSDINSPSSALGCVRASYYSKIGIPKKPVAPRVQRIFGNGHGVHYRLQKYLKDMDVLLMKEVPLFNKKYNIQGHTDGILKLNNKYDILEIKSINTREFSELKQARKKDRAQAGIYIFCLETHRKSLQEKYASKQEMNADEENRRRFYARLYKHLQSDTFAGGKTKEQKIAKKVREHFEADNILYDIKKPITSMTILYEDKNTQELKDYVVEQDDDLVKETLNGFIKSDAYTKLGVIPPRECSSRNNQCDYCDECFK